MNPTAQGTGAALCFPRANPNPLAPPWMFPSEWLSETPPGYWDEFQLFSITTALTASAVVTSQLRIDTSGQCNFYWRGLGVFLFGGAGTPTVRIRDSQGFILTNTRVALANDAPFGRQNHITPFFVAHRMAPGSILSFDFAETSGAAGVTVVMMIHGIKRWVQNPNVDWRGGTFGPGQDAPTGATLPGLDLFTGGIGTDPPGVH